MELTSEIKDMKTWDEANLWLERNGWGPALIAGQKEIWDKLNPAPISEADIPGKPIAEQVAEAGKPIVKPVAKHMVKEVKSVKKGK